MAKTRYEKPANDQPASCLLGDTPKEIRTDVLYTQCLLATLGAFAQTSQKAEHETAFLRLLSASINSAPEFLDEVDSLGKKTDPFALSSIAMLKKHPELLFKIGCVKDHYGREICASPYQIFLGAGDVWALKQIHEEIIPLIPNGTTEAQNQFRDWFPNYEQKREPGQDEEFRLYDARNKRQIADIMKQLDIVKQLIAADPFTNNVPLEVTKQAVEDLCQLFRATRGEVIRSGLHFPLAIIREIYYAYRELPKGFSFFLLKVIYPALEALSTIDGLCCRFGLYSIVIQPHQRPARRSNPAFEHPIGQPLRVMFAGDSSKRVAALVDPEAGAICFLAKDGFFDWFRKNGLLLESASLVEYDERKRIRAGDMIASGFDQLSRVKMSTFQDLYAHSPSLQPGT